MKLKVKTIYWLASLTFPLNNTIQSVQLWRHNRPVSLYFFRELKQYQTSTWLWSFQLHIPYINNIYIYISSRLDIYIYIDIINICVFLCLFLSVCVYVFVIIIKPIIINNHLLLVISIISITNRQIIRSNQSSKINKKKIKQFFT